MTDIILEIDHLKILRQNEVLKDISLTVKKGRSSLSLDLQDLVNQHFYALLTSLEKPTGGKDSLSRTKCA